MMKMKIQENKQIEVSRFSGLSGYRDISHFTTTRHGGVSTGTYASMNPGVYTEDDPGFIRKNLELLSDAVGIFPREYGLYLIRPMRIEYWRSTRLSFR